MQSVIVTKNDADKRLDRFLEKLYPALPQSLMYKYIRTKRIKVNGGRAQISTRLVAGDKVDLYVNDEFLVRQAERYDFLGASKRLDVIYEDDNVLLLDKAQGLLAHPDDTEYVDTLITRVYRYLYDKGEYDPAAENSFAPALVNRIDRNTRGIVIAAKNAEALRILNEKMKNRELHKYYLCVAHGAPSPESGIAEGWLVKDEARNMVEVYDSPRPGAKSVSTKYSVLAKNHGFSLVEIELLTGRTHQIRAQFAHIGHPLLGDGKYGRNSLNKALGYKKQFLCSYKLIFDFTTDAGALNYLNSRCFELTDVWFRREFEDGSLFEQGHQTR